MEAPAGVVLGGVGEFPAGGREPAAAVSVVDVAVVGGPIEFLDLGTPGSGPVHQVVPRGARERGLVGQLGQLEDVGEQHRGDAPAFLRCALGGEPSEEHIAAVLAVEQLEDSGSAGATGGWLGEQPPHGASVVTATRDIRTAWVSARPQAGNVAEEQVGAQFWPVRVLACLAGGGEQRRGGGLPLSPGTAREQGFTQPAGGQGLRPPQPFAPGGGVEGVVQGCGRTDPLRSLQRRSRALGRGSRQGRRCVAEIQHR